MFELQISIALDEEEMDNDFMLFINENDIYNPVIRLENSELEKVCFDTFHSWVGFGFQKAQLFNCGIPMGITVNSDIVSYYFNDFSYDNFSNYHRVYEINKRVSRPFKRDLKIEEIFIRTHIINYSYKEIKLVSSNNKKKNIVELKNSVFKSRVLDLNTNDTIENEEKLKLGNPYERKECSGIDVIIKYFESTVNEGMSFNLNECKYEK